MAGVIGDSAGNLYGTTQGGGDVSACGGVGCGVVYKLDATGDETVLYTFTGGTDGGMPIAGVIRDAHGNLYGTASEGGATGFGLVYVQAGRDRPLDGVVQLYWTRGWGLSHHRRDSRFGRQSLRDYRDRRRV